MPAKSARPKDKIDALHDQMRAFKALELVMQAAPDHQVSLTDRMGSQCQPAGGAAGWSATTSRSPCAASPERSHEVTNVGNNRAQLVSMAGKAKEWAPTRSMCHGRPRLVQRRGKSRPANQRSDRIKFHVHPPRNRRTLCGTQRDAAIGGPEAAWFWPGP